VAECGAKIGVHYYKNIDAANDTLAKVRERRSDGFIVQADVNRTDDIRGMMDHVKSEFGKLDIFVSNARPENSRVLQAAHGDSSRAVAASHQFAGNCFFVRGPIDGSLDGKRWPNHRHHPFTWGAVGELATLGGDGIGKSRHGVSGALLRRRPCQAWYHRELTQPWRHLRRS